MYFIGDIYYQFTGSAMPPLVMSLIFNATGEQAPWFIRPIARAISGGVHKSFIDPNLNAIQDMCEVGSPGCVSRALRTSTMLIKNLLFSGQIMIMSRTTPAESSVPNEVQTGGAGQA